MDIPIDPALLEEEGGFEDAEGEIDEEYIDANQSYIEPQYEIQNTYLPQYEYQPRASSSKSEIAISPAPISKKRKPRTSTSVTKPRRPLNGVNGTLHAHAHAHLHSHSHMNGNSKSRVNGIGKGKGKGKAHALTQSSVSMNRSVSVETVYTRPPPEMFCSFCKGTKEQNAKGVKEKMVSCAQCGRSGHPSCLRMTPGLAKYVMTYDWKCLECKPCEICKVPDSSVMFCDGCDRGYHHWCLDPPLPGAPDGAWYCDPCHAAGRAKKHSKHPPAVPTPDTIQSNNHTMKLHPPPLIETPTSQSRRRGRPPKSLQASRLSQSIHLGDPADEDDGDVFATQPMKPRIKIKAQDKGKGRQSAGGDESPFMVKIRIPSGGARKTVEVESEEEKEPFGGIITGPDADTTKTATTELDKERFRNSLMAADSKLGGPPPGILDYDPGLSIRGSPAPSLTNGHDSHHSTPTLSRTASTPQQIPRGLRDRLLQQTVSGTPGPSITNGTTTPGSAVRDRTVASTSEKIKTIRFGTFDIDTWYSAPYPEEYQNVPDGRLWLCEFCLKYMKSGFVAGRHRLKCKTRHPPGDEIYRDGNISVFEVDGRKNKIYCQNLCLLAKMFLDHKTLYYDVEPFLFYVMTEVDELGARFVGYFSKEKRSIDNNVSCIMTLPVRQRKGWGQLLIDFSYALSKKENRVGSPEKPLSGLGEVTYKRYWKISVFEVLRSAPLTVTMDDISRATSMTIEDIYSTLVAEDMIVSLESPPRPRSYHTPLRGRRGRGRGRGGGSTQRRIARESTQQSDHEDSDKPTIPKRYTIRFDRAYIEAVMKQHESRGYLTLKHERVKYHPFLVSRDPVKPPGFLAKATLTQGNIITTDADNGAVAEVEDDPQVINHGRDEATLQLVAKLSESPVRSLRKRPASSSEPASMDRSRPKRARRTMNQVYGHVESPRRSGRGMRVADAPLDVEPITIIDDDDDDDGTPLTIPAEDILGPGDGTATAIPVSPTPVDLEEDLDADADGEADLDADGEWEEDDPDPDPDLDAEGEDEYVEE